MTDVTKMSNDELMRIARGEQASAPASDVSKMSNEELIRIASDRPQPKPSIGSAVGTGINEGLTFGFFDEAIGAVRAASDKIGGSKEPFAQLYSKHRDELRAFSKEARGAHPVAFAAGELGGAAATMAVPGVRALAPSAGMSVANVAKGAGIGAIGGAGASEANPLNSPVEAKKFAGDVALGGAIGGVAQGVFDSAAKGLSRLAPSNLTSIAEQRAVKAGTGQQVKVIKDLQQTKQLQKVGADLLATDEAGKPVVGMFSRAEDVAVAAKEKQKFFGKKIEEVSRQIDELIPDAVDGKEISQRILDYAAKIPDGPQDAPLIKKLLEQAEYFEKIGNLSFEKAQQLKNRYKFKVTDPTTQHLGQDATNAVRNAIGDSMDNAARVTGQIVEESVPAAKDLLSKYEMFKSKYGSFATIAKAGEKRTAGNLSNRFISPSDYFSGGLGGIGAFLSTGEPFSAAAIAAGGALINKISRERGNAFMATSLKNLAVTMEKTPQALKEFSGPLGEAIKGGPGALVITHMALMRDPKYRSALEIREEQPSLLPKQTTRAVLLPRR